MPDIEAMVNAEARMSDYEMVFAEHNERIVKRIIEIANKYKDNLEISKACSIALKICEEKIMAYDYIDNTVLEQIEELTGEKKSSK